MRVNNQKFWKDNSTKSLRKITISLSPVNNFNKRHPSIPKIPESRPKKSSNKEQKSPNSYSIAYIGDNSGKLSISVQRARIPLLTSLEKAKHRVSNKSSPAYSPNSNHQIHQYFRPKPLTPASIRLYDFSEYKHKATSVGVKYRLKKTTIVL